MWYLVSPAVTPAQRWNLGVKLSLLGTRGEEVEGGDVSLETSLSLEPDDET